MIQPVNSITQEHCNKTKALTMNASNKLGIIIGREYFERVRRKSFIITTILMPILMVALMAAPALIMSLAGTEEQLVAVVDQSGYVGATLTGDGSTEFTVFTPSGEDAGTLIDTLKDDDTFDALLVIGHDITSNTDNVSLYTRGAPSMKTEMFIGKQIEDAVEARRLEEYDIDNLRDIVASLHVNVSMNTFRIDKEEEEATSSGLSYILGLVMSMTLYMFLIIYGQMVMTSIIEEKNNRVLEIMVSSVRPQWLMLGKILGIALVAVTQIVIWGVLLVMASSWLLPLLPAESADGEIAVAVVQLANTSYIIEIVVCLLLFMVGGFLFYASIYAAIGSSVDNIQDASQLSSFAVVPVIVGIMAAMAAINDPSSPLAFWTSIIPFTSPMVMMARLPFGIPMWQTALSLIILAFSFVCMLWLTAKIYRVGIFMYGKKASIKDLIRWINYK